jgi:23S rRNA pseudouridine1911/1915/1917 synthase
MHADALSAEIFTLKIKHLHEIGMRLDKFLAQSLPFSRTLLQKWIEQGYVSILSKKTDDASQTISKTIIYTAKYKLNLDDVIEVQSIALPKDLAFTAQNIPIDIVFEDEHLCIVNKAAGMVTHPAPGNWEGTLLNALLHHYPQNANLARAGIVHRLDKMTSGLMVIAKDLETQTGLSFAMQQHEIKRQYLAIVQGIPLIKGMVHAPIGRHPTQRTKMAVIPHGKPAITHYTRICNMAHAQHKHQSHSLIQCDLETGRTHQIRVHMAHIGHALLGDVVYNKVNHADTQWLFAKTGRQALHAVALSFIHPLTGEFIHHWAKPKDELMLNALNMYDAYRSNTENANINKTNKVDDALTSIYTNFESLSLEDFEKNIDQQYLRRQNNQNIHNDENDDYDSYDDDYIDDEDDYDD